MDIDQDHFKQHLLSILTHISNAKFVTFDFEMSGITTRSRNGDRLHDMGKPTLQRQYEEMKSVAESFQVLQVGICCVEEDLDREYYLARPFNFNLTPLQANGVDFKMDRNFEMSTSACEFLVKNNFNFQKVFTAGVPYLSREEEAEIRKREAERNDKASKIQDVVLAPGSPELQFYREARTTISTWVKDPKPDKSWVNIGYGNEDKHLNGFQRRLVYQLVRSEFPGYRTFPRNDGSFMQIVKTDPEEEQKRQRSFENKVNDKIAKQIGLRWIFEALSNGDLDSLPVDWFCDDKGEEPELRRSAIQLAWSVLKKNLREKDHILVGHNLFTDLIFLYNTFFGTLPDNVTEFQEIVHVLFPYVMDTKYIHTEGDNAMGGRANLKEMLEPLHKLHTPLIVLHEEHTAYGSTLGRSHEAGFDSWMTAELFVKLTSKLYAERKTFLEDRDTDSESGSAYAANSGDEDDDSSGGALLDFDNSHDSGKMDDDLPPGWHAEAMHRIGQNRFATLMDLGEAPPAPDESAKPEPKQWIPSWDCSFWDIYTNKLRVNAADTGVCDLDGI